MSAKLKMNFKAIAVAAAILSGMFSLGLAHGAVVQCGTATCSSGFKLDFQGTSGVGTGELLYDAKTGDISLNTNLDSTTGNVSETGGGGLMWTMGDGSTISVGSLSGNADPILGFGLGASTSSTGSTFGFTFNLPIALQGPINADSSVSYSLTSTTAAGAQIAPVVGSNIVSAFEVDTSVGGLLSLNKGVDIGSTLFFTGGPLTQNSPVYTASNTFTGNLAYDLMTVKVDFSLSADSTVGLSGFVQQVAVPIPAAVWLFGSGLLGLVGIARRKKA
jgi:hypothetical protein